MHRPPSSSSSVVRQRRVSQLQTDESHTRPTEPLVSPSMTFTGNLDYATLVTEPFAHELAAPLRPMNTTFAPGLQARPFPFILGQPPRTHHLASPLSVEAGLDVTRASSIALPPTPESSTASAMVSTPGANPVPAPAPTSLPPTLLAFSRAYDRYTFRQPLPLADATAPLPEQLDPSVPFDIPTSRSALDMYASGPGGLPLDPSLEVFALSHSGTPPAFADALALTHPEFVPDPGMIPIYTSHTTRPTRPMPAPFWPPVQTEPEGEALTQAIIPVGPSSAGKKRARDSEEPGDDATRGARKRRSTISDPPTGQ